MRSFARARYACPVAPARAGRRSRAGSVSRRPNTTTPASSTPTAASATNTPSHRVQRSSTPPSVGAMIGAAVGTTSRRDSIRAKAASLNRSRRIAVAITPAVATPTPCTTRSAARAAMEGVTVHNADATT